MSKINKGEYIHACLLYNIYMLINCEYGPIIYNFVWLYNNMCDVPSYASSYLGEFMMGITLTIYNK